MKMGWMVGVLVLGLGGASYGVAQMGAAGTAVMVDTFTNPLLDRGPDPWVVWWKGFYYYSNSERRNLALRKTADITDLRNAEVKTVWTPEPGHAWSKEVWAPELHRWGKKWFIYFAADAGGECYAQDLCGREQQRRSDGGGVEARWEGERCDGSLGDRSDDV